MITFGTPANTTTGNEKPTENSLGSGELPRKSQAQPFTLRTIIKLDQNSMVWAYEGIATRVESIAPFFSIFFTAAGALIAYMAGSMLVDATSDLEGKVIAIVGGLFSLSLCLAVAIYGLKISLFSRYGDLHFNRKTGRIYTTENNRLFELDWKYVRPYAAIGFGPIQLGAPASMSLQLVEYLPDQPDVWRARITVEGLLPNREGCQQVWEMIRRYMEDPPEAMPPQEVVPGGRTWSSALLEFGPLADGGDSASYISQLRTHNWWPIYSWLHCLNLFIWIIFWPDPVSAILYARFRRKATLPPDWIASETPAPSEQNPYRVIARDTKEQAGRRKAAWIVGSLCAFCCAISMTIWSFMIYAMFFAD